MEVVSYLHKKNQPGIIAEVDFEKCFDRVEPRSLCKTLQYFGFGQVFTDYIMLLHRNFMLCTINNGSTSQFFPRERGCGQGCPASPGTYLLCGELLNHLVSNSEDIRGLNITYIRDILSQFADDTGAFLNFDAGELNAFSDQLGQIERNVGLKVSYEKTTLYRVGSLADSDASLFTTRRMNWTNEPIDTLGVHIPCDNSSCAADYATVIEKMRQVASNWYNRSLSLMGRVTVINTLLASIPVYKMLNLTNLTVQQIAEMEGIMKDLLWKGNKARIALTTLQARKEYGGLRLTDIKARQDTLKIAWVMEEDEFVHGCIREHLCKVLGPLIWQCNLELKDVQREFNTENFWVQVLAAWSKINFHHPTSRQEARSELVWRNSHIKIQGQTVKWWHWWSKGILQVGDLFEEDGSLIPATGLPGVNWLEHRALVEAIPQSFKQLLQESHPGSNTRPLFDRLKQLKKPNRTVYDLLTAWNIPWKKYVKRWPINYFDEDIYKSAFPRLFRITNTPKLRDFQYRLLLGKLVTNEDLMAWGKADSPNCRLCNNVESIAHCLFDCEFVTEIVHGLEEWIRSRVPEVSFTLQNWLLNNVCEKPNNVVNHVVLITKQWLYRQKCRSKAISWNLLKREIEWVHQLELYISREKGTKALNKHCRKWGILYPYLLEDIVVEEEEDFYTTLKQIRQKTFYSLSVTSVLY